MKRAMNSLLMIATTLGITNASAMVQPGWERPILSAQMKKISAVGHFNFSRKANLTLTKKDGAINPTGMRLELEEYTVTPPIGEPTDPTFGHPPFGHPAFTARSVKLKINNIETDGCGSTIYYARLMPLVAHPELTDAPTVGARFTITLKDHSTRICTDLQPNLWEAHVREGFGWCGTGDATMDLVGNPREVFTRADLPLEE